MNVVYVSYDGALDPLGSSQVIPYVLGLARRGVRLSLVTFEKPARWADTASRGDLHRMLDAAGVRWIPLPYHRRPRLIAKALDFAAGRRALRRELAQPDAVIVHCRGEVAMAMARSAAPSSANLLYDVRGFFSEERVQGGSWQRGGLIDRAVRRIESANWDRADGLVVLTETALRQLRHRHGRLPLHRVIPTCVDLQRFHPAPGLDRGFGVVYGGSLGSAYPSQAIVDFARVATRELAAPALFLTPQPAEAARAGAVGDWCETRTVLPSEMPAWLRRCRAAFCLYRPGAYLAATSPTKLGEALATGLPVAVNRGVGDLDEVLAADGVGVLVEDFSTDAYGKAALRLRELAEDPGTAARCRRVAEARFSLTEGVERYHALYGEMTAGAARA